MRDHREWGCGSSKCHSISCEDERESGSWCWLEDWQENTQKNTDMSTLRIWGSQVNFTTSYPVRQLLILKKKGINQAWASNKAYFSLIREVWIGHL
jgi:hypothetical protein